MTTIGLMHHLQRLSVDIGARPIGSPANHAATSYVRTGFRTAGLEVREQRFDCPHWEAGVTDLRLDEQRLVAVANTFSPPGVVTAPIVAIATLAELEETDLSGRIGLLYGDLMREVLAAKHYPVYISERHSTIINTLELKRPAALIAVQHDLGSLVRLIEDWDLGIPSVTVPPETGLVLLQHRGAIAHLRVDSQRSASYGTNLIATKHGARPERIVLCAHFDTKIDTPGAYDNGGGTAVLLALAEYFGSRPSASTLEFIAFNGEEYYAIGDMTYVAHGAGFDQVVAAINLDGVGQALGANTIVTFASSPAFTNAVEVLTEQYRGVIWTDPWPASNHYTFYSRGVPSIGLSSIGITSLLHQPTDTIDWVSEAKLQEVTALVISIVDLLQDKPAAWTRV